MKSMVLQDCMREWVTNRRTGLHGQRDGEQEEYKLHRLLVVAALLVVATDENR
eukprot:SAG11_NODE_1051_length_6030_cov_24.259147_1_plen_53_part_00